VKILFTGQNAGQGLKDSDSTSLLSVSRSLGHQLCENLDDGPDVLICVDWSRPARALVKAANRFGVTTVLIIFEPSVVTPAHINSKVRSLFSGVIEVGRPGLKRVFKWPQTWDTSFFDREERSDRAVAISANKYSFLKGELYSLRAKCYAEIPKVDLYGPDWETPIIRVWQKVLKELQIAVWAAPGRVVFHCLKTLFSPPLEYRGVVPNKLEALSKYRTSLVIENSCEYMSEKLLDCLLAGTLPVYVGPEVEDFGIPGDLVIRCPADSVSVANALDRVDEESYALWKKSARNWILDDDVKSLWDSNAAIEKILEEVEIVRGDQHDKNYLPLGDTE